MSSELTADLLEAVSRSVEARLGLYYPRERWADLERGLGGAAKELGFKSTEACAREMAVSDLDGRQIDSLAAHLTIGETYFFRDPSAFAALENQVLPAILQARQGRPGRLRIWSAGCCTGEEPYSIAMALSRSLPDFKQWQISILGTDLNPRFLQKAVHGVYSQWSFRGVCDAVKEAFFRPTKEGRFEVADEIKRMVEFGSVNLVEDVYPSLTNNTNVMDVIFCRNVMMYFTREQMRTVVAGLGRCLTNGGLLFVSPTEASQEQFAGFSPAGFAGTAAYRKGAPVVRAVELAPAAFAWDMTPPPPKRPASEVVTPCAPAAPINGGGQLHAAVPDHFSEARQFANEGRLAEALAACDEAIGVEKLSPASHYLRGVILHEQNEIEEAASAMKRALYLDHDFIVAHFALGNLMLRQGRIGDARRCFENARALLKLQPPETTLPESDGVTAGRLLAILASMQEVAA